ncbi:hypothetical protein NPIL_384851 [Nephila pilipes]|uniref:Uncharacterized protein n=1 Tax=Nephila pilipes TaxID=299642 RepID=A0A8X6Q664_NEPPI|nr:hypothetical protein NPIL_384851 [Nephila pilipes]
MAAQPHPLQAPLEIMTSTPDNNNPGECLSLFLDSYSVDTIRENIIKCNTSADCLNLNLFIEDKLNQIPTLVFPNENFKLEFGNNLRILIEEARIKYSCIKQEEIKNELAQFNNLCSAWGIANPNSTPTPSPAKQRGNFSPTGIDNPKKQKTNNSAYYNRFNVVTTEDPVIDIEIDDEETTNPTPPQPAFTPVKTKKNTKKGKNTAKPNPVNQSTSQPSSSTAPLASANTLTTQPTRKSTAAPPITIDNVTNSITLLK